MSATDYTYDDRDLRFLLFELLKIQDLCQYDAYKDFGREDFDMIVSEAVKFAKDKIGPTNREGDEVGAKWEDGKVTVPPIYQDLYKAYSEAGWLAGNGSMEYGAQGLPHCLTTAVADIFTGANTAFFLYGLLGVGVAHVLEKYATAGWMKNMVIPKLYEGVWGGTMVLTEPGAGSDVGNAKTKAEKVEGEDYYLISGAKIFITGGDQDLTENIWHLVLARTEGAPKGTKGLSLFLVPKIRVDENGALTEPNDVACVGIEHKMGIIGSATCQLSFGDNGQCRGWLIGDEECKGILMMFNMMNEARIEVGIQGCSSTNAAYRNALGYAQERLQGSSIKEFKNPDAPRVPIIQHPDVRRMLLTLKSFGEGMRSLLCYSSWCNDMSHHAETEEERAKYKGFMELLTPICKAYCTDRGVELTSLAVQVYGGYGYTKDYPVEQLMRDVKIGCLYEGTNSIQALDLMGRKLGMKGGAVFMGYAAELDRIAEMAKESKTLGALADPFLKAKNLLVEAAMTLGGWGMQGQLDKAASRANYFLDLMGDVVMAAELLKAAVLAEPILAERLEKAGVDAGDAGALAAHLEDSTESAFYHGKVMNARFFVNNILPRTEWMKQAIMMDDMSHMEVVF